MKSPSDEPADSAPRVRRCLVSFVMVVDDDTTDDTIRDVVEAALDSAAVPYENPKNLAEGAIIVTPHKGYHCPDCLAFVDGAHLAGQAFDLDVSQVDFRGGVPCFWAPVS